jgi:CHAT domain-containing protein/NB-ARC domain-containing protein
MFSYENGIAELVRNLPWESLYYYVRSAEKGHLGLSHEISVSRYLPKSDTAPLQVPGQLVVFAIASNPHLSYSRLGTGAELDTMGAIVAKSRANIDFRPLNNVEWENFTVTLPQKSPNVLIFMGHCDFIKNQPHLIFQTAAGYAFPVAAAQFANELKPYLNTLRLVILSACQSSVTRPESPFSSAALSLVDAGIPAVVAMQSNISDDAAREFDHKFFINLLQQRPIDECVNAGRTAIVELEREKKRSKGNEWSIPILYLSTREEQLFDFSASIAINAELEQRLSLMEERFPRVSRTFVKRQTLEDTLDQDFVNDGITVVYGPFGAGKTEMISAFCGSKIHLHTATNPLFFYVKCDHRWTLVDDILQELDRQGRSLGFLGFAQIVGQTGSNTNEVKIRSLSELLSLRRHVIVFDDYIWSEGTIWSQLAERLAHHVRKSKIYCITSSPDFQSIWSDTHRTIPVNGLTEEEIRTFFEQTPRVAADLDEMMRVAATVDGLPWYLKLIRDAFEKPPKLKRESSRDIQPRTYIDEVIEELNQDERTVLNQMAVLRKPETLKHLATMIDRKDNSRFLQAAVHLQRKSLVSLSHDLTVYLEEDLKKHYWDQMSSEERERRHYQTGLYYSERANL